MLYLPPKSMAYSNPLYPGRLQLWRREDFKEEQRTTPASISCIKSIIWAVPHQLRHELQSIDSECQSPVWWSLCDQPSPTHSSLSPSCRSPATRIPAVRSDDDPFWVRAREGRYLSLQLGCHASGLGRSPWGSDPRDPRSLPSPYGGEASRTDIHR